jgi:hypothetical protein
MWAIFNPGCLDCEKDAAMSMLLLLYALQYLQLNCAALSQFAPEQTLQFGGRATHMSTSNQTIKQLNDSMLPRSV